MSTLTTLSRSEFTLLVRNRLLLFNAFVLPLVFPVLLLVIGWRSDTGLRPASTGESMSLGQNSMNQTPISLR